MILKRSTAACFPVLVFVLFFTGQLVANMNVIIRFKKVSVPVDLLIDGSILPKGAYDLEFLRANPLSYYLRIMNKGKILHLVQGKEFLYDNTSAIPRKPTLRMSKNPVEKLLIIVFESGSDTTIYERCRASFHIEYKEG